MNILEIFRRYNVYYVTEHDPHVTRGWAGMSCPYCTGKPGNHLGIHLTKLYAKCWRCGFHPLVETIATLCHVSRSEALTIYRSLDGGGGNERNYDRDAEAQKRIAINPFKRPSDCDRMTQRHRDYLASRNFDPDEIERVWDVAGTGPAAYLDHIDYRHRILIPIHWEGREVSFQARDITGKSDTKYRACPMDREAVHHKAIVYAHPRVRNRVIGESTGIAVEGVTDVWRLGPMAFATFGIQYKVEQLSAIADRYDRVAVVFDGERQAQLQARKLVKRLDAVGVRTKLFPLSGGDDPGSMTDDDARHLVAEVTSWGNLT